MEAVLTNCRIAKVAGVMVDAPARYRVSWLRVKALNSTGQREEII
jgi:hypothetical protein